MFGRGWGLGVAIAAPVGPIGILCIQRSLRQGWRFGLASGLGAATADGFYGCVAGFGLVAVSQALVAQQIWLRLGGGLFLIGLGLRALSQAISRAEAEPAALSAVPAASLPKSSLSNDAAESSLLTAYGSTLLLTLTNPVTILSFAAMFAGLGTTAAGGWETGLLVFGVFCGSACWWLLLCAGVGLLRQRITARQQRWIRGGSAGLLLVFGLGAVASLVV